MKEVEKNERIHALAIRKHAMKISSRRKPRIEESNEAFVLDQTRYKAILDGDGDLDNVMPEDTSDNKKKETVGEAKIHFRISKEITKSFTLTATEDTVFKDHIV